MLSLSVCVEVNYFHLNLTSNVNYFDLAKIIIVSFVFITYPRICLYENKEIFTACMEKRGTEKRMRNVNDF